MSSMTKVVLGVLVLIVIVGGSYWYMHSNKTSTGEEAATTQDQPASDQSSISAQLTAIDGQIQAFESDDAAVDAGISDQPVDQSTL